MNQFLYDIATTLAAPPAKAWLALSPRHRPLLARFSPPSTPLAASPIWVHACSVGELGVAKPVLMGLRGRDADCPLLLTVSTRSAWEMASGMELPATLAWFPVDQRGVVRRFFDHVDPSMLVLMETEIWPNVLHEAQRRNVPAIVLNGRISDKHMQRYAKLPRFFKQVFGRITAAGVQHSVYADRFQQLGLDATRVRITGNIKFDNVITAIDRDILQSLRATCGLETASPIIVFGSTRPGDEALAAECWNNWRQSFPSATLIVAPRHANRLSEAIAPFDEPILLRSQIVAGKAYANERILVIDTLGELTAFYALATVAIVGGSFYPGVNGHNPLEPAALGVPTVFGPYMRNFLDPAEALLQADAAIQVHTPGDLCAAVTSLLNDAPRRASLASAAARAIEANQGALAKSLDLLQAHMLIGNRHA